MPSFILPKPARKKKKFSVRLWLECCGVNKSIYGMSTFGWRATIPNAAAGIPKRIRNVHWRHVNSMRILSMPDKWEFPWFAAWDLAFQCISLALVDPDFAKENLWVLLFEQFQHPNGQIPAYEWEFSDLNPPCTPGPAGAFIRPKKAHR